MKRLFLFLTVAAAVCCAACRDDPEVAESNLSLLEDNVTFDMSIILPWCLSGAWK